MNSVNAQIYHVIGKVPMLTIVTPAYNSSSTILDVYKCLKSLLSDDVKWNIVNDCSSDNSAEILDEICANDINVSVFHLPENGGPNKARRYGIAQSRTDLVYLLDADDFIYNESFRDFICFIKDNPGYDFYYAPLKPIHSPNEFDQNERFIESKVINIVKPTDFIRYSFPQPSSLVIKKDKFLIADKENELKWGEDFFMYLCLAKNGIGVRWKMPVSCYLITGDGRGSILSLRLRLILSKELLKYSLSGKEKRFDSIKYTIYLTLRHIASYCYKKAKSLIKR